MPEPQPLQPDNIIHEGISRPVYQYPRYRYTCSCPKHHAWEGSWDQLPPELCSHGSKFRLDRDYEAYKRITVDSVNKSTTPNIMLPPVTVPIHFSSSDPDPEPVVEQAATVEPPPTVSLEAWDNILD